jgi:glycosyltransferase involved in cell wall biosynthesis
LLDPECRAVADGPQDPVDLSIIGCAFNEERALPGFLEAVLAGSGASYRLREVIIVASGCTDGTVDRLRAWADRDVRVRPVLQGSREGKAAALLAGLRVARGNAILLANVDTRPVPGAIEALVRPLRDPATGLSCARCVPARFDPGFSARLGRLVWDLHDLSSQELPKSTGAIAFRAGAIDLPVDIEDDDTYLGILLGRERGRSVYARDAIFLLHVPSNPKDLLGQRFRINFQILGLHRRTGMVTSTWRPAPIARCLVRFLRERPGEAFSLAVLGLLELGVRGSAIAARLTGGAPLVVWAPVLSTKGAIEPIAADP